MFCYSDTEGRSGGLKIDLAKINPNGPYAKHLSNWYYLKFIAERGSTLEKIQATKELTICERKLAWWYKHPAFSVEQAGRDVRREQSIWTSIASPLGLLRNSVR